MTKSKIDFERAAALMDVVQKVANVVPAYTALSSAALNELREMQDVASKEQAELGRQKLKADQEEAARLDQEAQVQADKQAAFEAKQKEIADAKSRASVKPINVKPGEPNELEAIKTREAQMNFDDETNHNARRI